MAGKYVRVEQAPKTLPGAGFAELMAAALNKDVPFRFTAPGFSMSPFIRDGDVLTIASGRPRFGDVVAFLDPRRSGLTVHRIVRVSRSGYLLKGDNVREADGQMPRTSILGRVVRVDHHGRRVRLGMGVERILIAWLSRRGWLTPLVGAVWRRLRPLTRMCAFRFKMTR